MLCDLIEGCNASKFQGKKEKCAKYFPQENEKMTTFGSTKITFIERTTSELGFVVSSWKVEDRNRQRIIRHLHCKTWPDHSAPKCPSVVVGIHREITKASHQTPIVVHCSAGVGRTCTLIGEIVELSAEVLLERIRRRRNVSGVAVMRWLRDRRCGAIQKSIQFVFMHYIVVEILVQ
ncbi:unnamed protein product, partial [Strongylus vulgaris]